MFNYSFGPSDAKGPQIDLIKKHAYLNTSHVHQSLVTRGKTTSNVSLAYDKGVFYQINPFKIVSQNDPSLIYAYIGSDLWTGSSFIPNDLI